MSKRPQRKDLPLTTDPDDFKIDKGVPMPAFRGPSMQMRAMLALADADIGDSVFFAGKKSTNVNQTARYIGQSGWIVTRTMVENGVEGTRAWKVANPDRTKATRKNADWRAKSNTK